MKKAISALFLALCIVLTGCSEKEVMEPDTPLDLTGSWKQQNSGSEDEYQIATIDENTITIYWYDASEESRSLYWSGTFDVPEGEKEFEIVSQKYAEITDKSLLSSLDDTKRFAYKDGEVVYETSVKGTTSTVRLQRTDEFTLETQKPASRRVRRSGFDPATNQTIDFHGIRFSFPAYFDVKDYESTEDYVHYYPEVLEYYCSLQFRSVEADITEAEFLERRPTIVNNMTEGREGYTLISSEEKNFAGLYGWVIGERSEDATIHTAFVFNPQSKAAICIIMVYDSNDQSNYDYDGDFLKILDSAKNLTPTVIPTPESTPTPAFADGMRPEFKAAMDSYEAFFDEYIAFMEKYEESDDSLSMLTDYVNYMSKLSDTMEKLDAIDEDELTDEELAYYTEVMLRISTKLMSVN